jgi:hypothetical protein
LVIGFSPNDLFAGAGAPDTDVGRLIIGTIKLQFIRSDRFLTRACFRISSFNWASRFDSGSFCDVSLKT